MPRPSDYEHFVESIITYSGLDEVYDLMSYLSALKGAEEYIEGVPWKDKKRESYEILKRVVEEYLGSVLEDVKSRLISELESYLHAIERYRPAYIETLSFLLENPEYIERYLSAGYREVNALYREIGEHLGYSWTTVRDAFSYIRQAGLIP